jgi:hypothetical protein
MTSVETLMANRQVVCSVLNADVATKTFAGTSALETEVHRGMQLERGNPSFSMHIAGVFEGTVLTF